MCRVILKNVITQIIKDEVQIAFKRVLHITFLGGKGTDWRQIFVCLTPHYDRVRTSQIVDGSARSVKTSFYDGISKAIRIDAVSDALFQNSFWLLMASTPSEK